MSYEPLPSMPGAWPSDDTDPTSPLTFTLSDFISAASVAQTYIDTTLHQSKSQVWLSETMTNMTLFTYAEELVEKSVAYVIYIAPYIGFFSEDQFPPPLVDGVILSYTLVETFKEGMETYWLTKSIQGLVASYLEFDNGNTNDSPRIWETAEVREFAVRRIEDGEGG
ncbi:hypothetical protein J4E80_005888 [Alternaria sp. BMP 0032]|nr:hypothetical protein J4E80_005888 [Alternaria sp. BMP 0032]